MNLTVTRQLTRNATSSGTWLQAQNISVGSEYTVPTTGRSTVNGIRVGNLGANSVTIDLAISQDNTPTTAERICAPIVLLAGESLTLNEVFVIPANFGLWIRATGTTPDVLLTCAALEYLLGFDPGTGGGAVTSVNGFVGVVVLGAADVGADPTGTATAAVAAHEAAVDPHPQYTTAAEATTIAGTAVTNHEALADPHPQYKRRILKEWDWTAYENPSSNIARLDVRNNRPHLDFDTTTQESAYFTGVIPYDCDLANGLLVRAYWAAETATTGTIGWDVAFERIVPSGIDMDSDSFGTAQTITAATVPGTSGVIEKTSVSFTQAQLPASLAPGDFFRVRIRRDVANDTATGDAELYKLVLELLP